VHTLTALLQIIMLKRLVSLAMNQPLFMLLLVQVLKTTAIDHPAIPPRQNLARIRPFY
jgi:hypothetical protein